MRVCLRVWWGLKNRGPQGHIIPLAPKGSNLELVESKGRSCNIQMLHSGSKCCRSVEIIKNRRDVVLREIPPAIALDGSDISI